MIMEFCSENGFKIIIYIYIDYFIGAGLGGMGYSCRLYKKTIPSCKFIRGQF